MPLVERGYRVTAVDLAEESVARCKAMADELPGVHRTDFRVGDARSLEGIRRGEFDAVLLMGPLYHLVVDADRTAALTAACECLKPGGVIFSALISRFGILGDLIKKNPAWRALGRWLTRPRGPNDDDQGGAAALPAAVLALPCCARSCAT